MDIEFYRGSVRHHGVGSTVCHAVCRAAGHIARVNMWAALAITPENLRAVHVPAGRRTMGRMLDAKAMRPYARDPANELTEAFLAEAAARGDRCYALFEGGTLANYGWYTTRPTRLSEVSSRLELHFDPAYVYMHNGFTLPRWRGHRLHAVGMSAALDQFAREGHKGLVSYVDSSNAASLRSCYRMGYERFGHLVLVRLASDRYVTYATPGCKAYRFDVRNTTHPRRHESL
jgi:hypothetical protein